MMEAIRSYLTAVVAVSMIAVLASALAHGSRMERVVRFAAGLLALLVCVTPLLRLDARTLTDVLLDTLAQYGALAGLIVLAALVMAAVSWAAKRLPEKKG